MSDTFEKEQRSQIYWGPNKEKWSLMVYVGTEHSKRVIVKFLGFVLSYKAMKFFIAEK